MDERILIIEDDPVITRFLIAALRVHGFKPSSEHHGVAGISAAMNERPDAILLDLGLPDVDGIEVLAQIRAFSAAPVIVISARDKEREKVEALDGGADDYLTKPFGVNELLARLRAVLRRRTPVAEVGPFVLGGIEADFEKRRILLDGEEIHLTPIEFRLFRLLAEHQGKVLTHSFIQDKVWGYASEDDYQSLRVFMASIRRKLERDTNRPRYIVTEIGVGYRLADE